MNWGASQDGEGTEMLQKGGSLMQKVYEALMAVR